MQNSEQPNLSSHASRRVVISIAIVTLSMLQTGCQKEKPSTMQEAVATLSENVSVISKALRAKNPSAADEQIHDSMYLADHLSEFESSVEVVNVALDTKAKRLLKLLMQAHTGAHGGTAEWDPNAVADEMTSILDELETLVKVSTQ